MLVKICGVQSPGLALFAAKAGAHFIGLVFDSTSKRYVGENLAKEIARAGKRGGAKIVGIFTHQTSEEMLVIYKNCDLDVLQLHSKKAIREGRLLPPGIPRIYAIQNEIPQEFMPEKDFLLYDHMIPGCGYRLDWETLQPRREHNFFLAGGLDGENVKLAIAKVRPNGVDVSSGVENDKGKKDEQLIKEFITNCTEEEILR